MGEEERALKFAQIVVRHKSQEVRKGEGEGAGNT